VPLVAADHIAGSFELMCSVLQTLMGRR
jgi:hypothetical protein